MFKVDSSPHFSCIFFSQTMVVPAEQDGKSGDCAELARDVGKNCADQLLNTRKGGVATCSQRSNPLVIVDMREFRSELPVLLHRRGIDIDPVTLQVSENGGTR